MATCPQCGQENPAAFRFCGSCAAPLSAYSAPEVRKVVSALFCDLVGSTALGERVDVETLRRVQARYFQEMRSAIERYGGTVAKYIGDAVVAVFGVPTLHEDDALRAVRAAAAMRDAISSLNVELRREWGVSLQTRIGVNSGEVVAGEEATGESFATGDTMNVAARLEQAAEPGEILIGHQTHELVRDAVSVVPVEPLRLKGKSEAVPAWRLIDVDTAAVPRKPRLGAPLVGRERELRSLLGTLQQVRDAGRGQLVTILGAAGVGKSRLADELVRSLHGQTTLLRGRCLPYGEMTFWPIAEVIRQACGITEEDSAEDARTKIAQSVRDELEHELVCSRLAGVLGLLEDTAESEETFWAIRKLLESLARRRPVLVVLDDLHSAEPTLLDLVEYLALNVRAAPVAVICLARPELLEKRPSLAAELPEAAAIRLDPLTPEETERLIGSLIGEGALAETAAFHIAEAARGNPLFIEEVLGMLVDRGLLRREAGAWLSAGDLSRIEVPPSLRALLGARLDALSREERQVLEASSVMGKEFSADAVAELVTEELRQHVPEHLGSLIRRGLLEGDHTTFAGGDALRFHHILVRDVAYESMPKRTRSELHERYAGLLERKWGDRLPEYEEIAGYQLERAFRLREQLGPVSENARELAVRAGRHLASAGRRAFGRGDMTAAITLLERAASLLPEGELDRPEVLLDLGVALMQMGDLGRSEQSLARAAKDAGAAGNHRLEWYASIELSGLRVDINPELGTESLLAEARSALSFFEQVGDDPGLAKVWRRLGFVHGVASHWAPAREAFEQALEHARQAGAHRDEAVAASMLFYCFLYGPTPVDEAIAACEQLLSEGRTYWSVEAVGLSCLAGLYAMDGRYEQARELLARSRAIFADLGQTRRMVEATFVAGMVEMLAGDAIAAERELRRGYEAWEHTGQKGTLASLAACLAEPLFSLGRYEEAHALTAFSEGAAGEDDVFTQVSWRPLRAKLLARAGDAAAAEQVARDAVARAVAQSDDLNLQAGAVFGLAEVLELAGRREDARATAAEAASLYAARGNRSGRSRAESLLARLAADTVERGVEIGAS